MNRKAMIERICDYVLDQDHERENTIEDMTECIKSGDYKKDVIERHKDFGYYLACVMKHGKREANKLLNECYREAVEAL